MTSRLITYSTAALMLVGSGTAHGQQSKPKPFKSFPPATEQCAPNAPACTPANPSITERPDIKSILPKAQRPLDFCPIPPKADDLIS